jgi:predicted metal-dependent hydrolase
VLAYGPHTDLELRTRALDVGCDAVVAKSRLVSALPELIEQYARRTDEAGLTSDCTGPLSELAQKGIALFNAGAYFEAHEELELAWNADAGPGRELYRGILQVAVAYLHLTRGNYRGALKMFLRLRQWLDPMPAVCRGVDVAQLRRDALAARAALEALGPDQIAEFDLASLQPVKMASGGQPAGTAA